MLRTIVFLLAALVVMPTFASPNIDALSKCIADNSTSKDRRNYGLFIIVSMSAHPEMQSISTIAPGALDSTGKVAGTTITRLITESCQTEARAAIRSDGASAMWAAFGDLFRVAMLELLIDKDVQASINILDKYSDKNKFEALGR